MSELPTGLVSGLSGRYTLERELGQGGMATVYLASDLRHHRRVALKVLRPELAAVLGPERFLSEIRTTANLQHPHLLPLFDSGEAEGLLFYVMPYVQGESLRQRLESERQLPVEEAVRIAAAVASALDYAHGQGVIHRDLKPENILLQGGQPLVADFGIALAVSNAGGARVTQTGLSLGTPAYMSPEQATGDRTVDARADIYSLAALTYEMLIGDPPHHASTSQAMIAKLLTERPRSVRAQRASVPEHVDLAIAKALEKLPADRFARAGEFADAITGVRSLAPAARGNRSARDSASARRRDVLLVGGSALITAAAVLAFAAVLEAPPAPPPVIWLPTTPPAGVVVGTGVAELNDSDLALSADGRRLVYVGRAGGQQRLYLHALDRLVAAPLAGTEGAREPFFSPDGSWIGYFDASSNLKKIPVAGGDAVTIRSAVGDARGASWGTDDRIVFATSALGGGLQRVPAAGGEVEVLTTPNPSAGERAHILPEVLPGARAVLYTVITQGSTGTRIEALDLATGARTVIVEGGSQPRYATSGHLVYAVRGKLQAVPFDPVRLEVVGDAAPVVEGVETKLGNAANFALSASGVLVYQGGDAGTAQARVVWVDRQGREEPLDAPPRAYFVARLSPDGSKVALEARDEDYDIWIWDLLRRTLTRLTSDPTVDLFPVWTPDGHGIVFASQREPEGFQNLYVQPADGTGEAQQLSEGPEQKQSYAFARDGRLIIRQVNPGTSGDVHVLSLGDERSNQSLIMTPFNESQGEVSPDGRWITYQSNESGAVEVYVRPFPDVNAGRWPISTGGGSLPRWAKSGRELFYLAADGRLTAVAVESRGSTFSSGNPTRVLERAYGGYGYDVSPDDRRFLMVKASGTEGAEAPPQLVVVLNWFGEIERLAGAR
jgi:eukaryotic-like serine/threonine-protein kinase